MARTEASSTIWLTAASPPPFQGTSPLARIHCRVGRQVLGLRSSSAKFRSETCQKSSSPVLGRLQCERICGQCARMICFLCESHGRGYDCEEPSAPGRRKPNLPIRILLTLMGASTLIAAERGRDVYSVLDFGAK